MTSTRVDVGSSGQTTNSNAFSNVTGLAIPSAILTGATVDFKFVLGGTGGGAGAYFKLTGPTTTIFLAVLRGDCIPGQTGQGTACQTGFARQDFNLNQYGFWASAIAGGVVIEGFIQCGNVNTALQLQFASVTNGQTTTIFPGSFLVYEV